MKIEGWPLDYFHSKEYLDVQDRLDEMEERGIPYNPHRDDIFRALNLCALNDVRVAILGEAPYADPGYATGVAFSSQKPTFEFRRDEDTYRAFAVERIQATFTPTKRSSIPASLRTLYREYVRDLSLPFPSSGCVEGWCDQGVLLWNVTPTIEYDRTPDGKWVSYTHQFWPEWPPLTQEIIERLSAIGGIVFVFLGNRARAYSRFVDASPDYNCCLFYPHPSPLAQRWTNNPIVGSRLFTTINDILLNKFSKEPIDWRLP